MKSSLSNALSTPRKVHLVLRSIKNIKNVNKMLITLRFINKKAAGILAKVIKSAKDNAQFYNTQKENTQKIPLDQLEIAYIKIGPGETRKRWLPRARGNSDRLLKRTTNIKVQLTNGQALESEVQTGEKNVN